MRRRFLIPMLGLTLAGALVWNSSSTLRFTYSQPVLEELAKELHLDAAEVQDLLDEASAEAYAMEQFLFEEKLAQEVRNGKITELEMGMQLALREQREIDESDPAFEFKGMSKTARQQELSGWLKAADAKMSA